MEASKHRRVNDLNYKGEYRRGESSVVFMDSEFSLIRDIHCFSHYHPTKYPNLEMAGFYGVLDVRQNPRTGQISNAMTKVPQ